MTPKVLHRLRNSTSYHIIYRHIYNVTLIIMTSMTSTSTIMTSMTSTSQMVSVNNNCLIKPLREMRVSICIGCRIVRILDGDVIIGMGKESNGLSSLHSSFRSAWYCHPVIQHSRMFSKLFRISFKF